MDAEANLQGEWWYLYEDAPFDFNTPLWTLCAGQITEAGEPAAIGRYEIRDGALHIEIASTHPGSGPEVMEIALEHSGDTFRQPWAISAETDSLSGSYLQINDDWELGSHCAILREGPSMDHLKQYREEQRTREQAASADRETATV